MPIERKHTQTPETLRKTASALEMISAQLRACAQTMEDEKISEMEMTHYDSMARAMHGLEGFKSAAYSALIETCQQRGDYGVNGTTSKPRGSRKGKK